MGADVVHHVLLTLAAVIATGFALGRVLRYFGQPPVIGEVVAGILLGPSLLGAISPEAMHALIPAPAADPHGHVPAAIHAIAQLGVIFYMFLVGIELDAPALRQQLRTAITVSGASIIVPFALGAGFAIAFAERLGGTPGVSFALFMGVAMAITAFPVLARILTDRRLTRTPMGSLALGCAAAGDVIAWCMLAVVVSVTQADAGSAMPRVLGATLFIAGMLLIVRPILKRFVQRCETDMPRYAIPVLLLAVLLAALATESIGIHALFGAFLLGAMISHESRIGRIIEEKLHDAVSILLLPAFFAFTGMRTQIGLVSGVGDWLWCAAIILVATLGKFGGTFFAARLTGNPPRESAALGALMNTRGLMELIVLNIGLEIGILGTKLYAMMVLMALVTTLMTTPMLHFFMRPRRSVDPILHHSLRNGEAVAADAGTRGQ